MDRTVRYGLVLLAVALIGFAAVWSYGLVTREERAAEPEATGPIVARPAPAEPPIPVEATGECAATMESIRALQKRFPSGALLDEAANAELTTALVQLDKTCAAHLATAFRDRELTPWLTYLP